MQERAYTPDSLAAHWGCSAAHVRNLIHKGELRAFRLGKRLFRIMPDAVREYEEAQLAILAEEAKANAPKLVPYVPTVLLPPTQKRRPRK